MSLKYEPASEPLHISVKKLFSQPPRIRSFASTRAFEPLGTKTRKPEAWRPNPCCSLRLKDLQGPVTRVKKREESSTSSIRNPQPSTLSPQPSVLNPQPSALRPEAECLRQYQQHAPPQQMQYQQPQFSPRNACESSSPDHQTIVLFVLFVLFFCCVALDPENACSPSSSSLLLSA